MDKYQLLSLGMSALAVVVSTSTAYLQYQSRQDAVNEQVRVEVKMLLKGTPLNPTDLRMLSGVDERANLKPAILLTNVGHSTVRIVEVGFQDYDQPQIVFLSGGEKARALSPGEQAIFPAGDIVRIRSQLTGVLKFGEAPWARIFAVSTKGSRFEGLPVIEVAE